MTAPTILYYYCDDITDLIWKEMIEPCPFYGYISFSEHPDLGWDRIIVQFKDGSFFSELHRVEYLRKCLIPGKSSGRLPTKEMGCVNQDGTYIRATDLPRIRRIKSYKLMEEKEWIHYGPLKFDIEDISGLKT